MNWQVIGALAGGIGIGTIVATVIQLIGQWKLEQYKTERAYRTWLRDKKLEIYTEVTRTFLLLENDTFEKEFDPEQVVHSMGAIHLVCDSQTLKDTLYAYMDRMREYTERTGSHTRPSLNEVLQLLMKDLHATK